MLIMRFTVFLVLFVLVVNIWFDRPLLESLMFALALAVGLTPELLPMIVRVTLARSALALARYTVIVKRLSAIHDLGAMDMLCTDKTGTLTEAAIRLVRVHARADINSWFESGMKSPLDEAILSACPLDMSGWRKIDEVPFDFERPRVSVLVESGAERRLIVKGGASFSPKGESAAHLSVKRQPLCGNAGAKFYKNARGGWERFCSAEDNREFSSRD